MRKGDVDLSYLGVSYLWTERLGNEKRRVRNQKATMNSAIHAWGKNVPAFEGERTSFPEHRQLCLAVCGWAFTAETLEDECQQMIDRGEPYEAIFRAVLHDKKQIALNLLRTLVRTRVVDNSALGPLLACGEVNETQRDMCLWMAADVENATLKALLGFLATGSWVEAIKTKQLPLANRLCLALKHLNDTDLSKFIEDETARAIREGDVQGVLLTGVNEAAMDLFQSYIARTDDVQTAVLATAYANYSSDIRWVMWKESYMQQMQTWHCFSERARFRIELSKIKDKAGLPTPAKQIGLRCHRCHAGLKRPANQGTPVKPPLAQSGTVCPLCGQHMPRCVICRQWLGMESRLLCFCTGCGHASHVDHANAWFERHATCPQPQCECQCLWEAKSRLPAD
ncbi:hypothetical protein K470DRAFT_259950 [Piedraia hortae CBS 480.64]|uniref:Uncharacterized protein n=1 Tax=Piedraia hortae CBS 480.64 TaxID=1314780 RepID=A0A6A7BT13_9PEZI|nr:hypothetical protein K470DRAFT_259950 [Piedraia hortae CBS 480.64]